MSYSSPGYPTMPAGATWEQVGDGWIGTYPNGMKIATSQQTATWLGAPFTPGMFGQNQPGWTPYGAGMGGMGGTPIYQDGGGGMGGMGGMGGSGIWNNPGSMGGGMGPQSIIQDTSNMGGMGGGMGGGFGGMPGMESTVTIFGPEGTQTFTPGPGGGWQPQPQTPWNGGGYGGQQGPYGGQQGGWQPSPQPTGTYPPMAPPPRTSGPASSGNRGAGGATKKKFANPPPIITKEQLEKDKTSCPICYTDFYDKDAEGRVEYPVRLPCGHVYGQKCIEEWIQETNSCPMCKKEFPVINAAGMVIGGGLGNRHIMAGGGSMGNRHIMSGGGGMGNRHIMSGSGGMDAMRNPRLSHIRDMRNRYYTGG